VKIKEPEKERGFKKSVKTRKLGKRRPFKGSKRTLKSFHPNKAP